MHPGLFSDFSHKYFVTYSQSVPTYTEPYELIARKPFLQ